MLKQVNVNHMIKHYYRRVFVDAERFNGTDEQLNRYGITKRLRKQLEFYLAGQRLHLGDWLVKKRWSNEPVQIVSNYEFKLRYRNEN